MDEVARSRMTSFMGIATEVLQEQLEVLRETEDDDKFASRAASMVKAVGDELSARAAEVIDDLIKAGG